MKCRAFFTFSCEGCDRLQRCTEDVNKSRSEEEVYKARPSQLFKLNAFFGECVCVL